MKILDHLLREVGTRENENVECAPPVGVSSALASLRCIRRVVIAPGMAEAGPRRVYRVLVTGDDSSGKTSVLRRLTNNYFPKASSSKQNESVGISYQFKQMHLKGENILLQVWDAECIDTSIVGKFLVAIRPVLFQNLSLLLSPIMLAALRKATCRP